MRTTVHPAATDDLRVVAEILADGLPEPGGPDGQFATHSVTVGGVPAEWVATPGTSGAGVVVYLHGGRFQRDEGPGAFAQRLSAATGLAVLLVHYRLAPENPFPAALDDTLAVWQGLLEQGSPAERTVFVGHSSGATLALAATQSLAGAGRPLPAAVIAVSPITDFTFSGESMSDNAGKDVIGRAEAEQVRTAYLAGADPAGWPASPLFGPVEGLPRLLIAYGEDEVLAEDARRFAQRADAAGVDVSLEVFARAPHGFPLLLPRAARTLFARIAAFVTANGVRSTGVRSEGVRSAGRLTIRRIGWAGLEIVSEAGTRVVVDPYQSGAEGFHSGLPESPVSPAELFGADVVAVTHAGFDHRGQALEIVKGGNAILASGPALFGAALDAGLPSERLAPMVSGVELYVRDVTIKALPARHDSTMSVNGGAVSDQPLSFLIRTAAGRRIFCAGDCSLSQDFRTWRELYRPEIAVLPIGGVWVGAVNVANLPPSDAAAAADWLGVSTVLPVHHRPEDPAPAQLAADLAARGETIEVVALAFGETWTAPELDEYDN
jgi:acetyl esterase/lipase/L-ascorbate metabolism protein UlaG (beta-lactamase superfamily)